MRFVSYAQNFEDVMLWRALKGYPPGLYVDVGANEPTADSVTKAFYERGWRGINVEALPSLIEKLRAERPDETNVQCFAGAEEGDVEFYEVVGTGLSTSRPEFMERGRAAGFECRQVTIPSRRLTSILEEAGVTNDSFHFLKVDVEGAEKFVLRGMDLERFRPWLLVVEATEPCSTQETHAEFEDLILPHRYEFIYFDGLSRFYVAEEHAHLRRAFETPPNVFDNYVRWPDLQTSLSLAETQQQLSSTHLQLSENQCLLLETQRLLEDTQRSLADTQNRLTQSELYLRRLWRLLEQTHKGVQEAAEKLKKASAEVQGSARWRWGGWLTRPFSKKIKEPHAGLKKASKALQKTINRLDEATPSRQ
jgi:FkbM family methyltransferase